MKANEAPEKIYVDANEDWHRTYTAFTEKAKGDDIEYIRKDAFIEKAVDYLNSQLYDWVSITNPNQRSCANVIPKRDFIEDFRKYMKGE